MYNQCQLGCYNVGFNLHSSDIRNGDILKITFCVLVIE